MIKILILFLLASCAQITSLNLRRHQFGQQPTKIIWFQVAGLNHEQLAMLRFGFPTMNEKTALEGSLCVGQAWTFNLYNLRPSAASSMMSQVTGKKNITGQCKDLAIKPIWKYISRGGYKSGIIEIGATDSQTMLSTNECKTQASDFRGESIFWSMREKSPSGAISYLPSVPTQFSQGQIYWDKTCRVKGCGSAIRPSVASVYSQFSRNSSKHIFIIRDFSFLAELNQKNFSAAREILRDIDKSVEGFYKMSEDNSNVLVLVTGAAPTDIDFPHEGKDWQKFDLNGSEAVARRGDLVIPVFAQGARAENFCGFYEENQVFERILSGPKQQGLELKVINPFN